ncbi:MAG: hypothetical protein CME70_06760 [Halobacteriovorax sp.]|nr:hypothetical protein [Halobacteriovorax sp.]
MSRSNSQKIKLDSPIELLFSSNKSKTLQSLQSAGVKTVYDLMWVFPLRIEKLPALLDFSNAIMGQYFRGLGIVKDIQKRPSNGMRGKGKIPLQNISVTVKDYYTDKYLSLKWFNSYPSITKKIEESKHLVFLGKLQEYNGSSQIVNPEINSISVDEIDRIESNDSEELKIQYPTINKMKGFNIKRTIDSIPIELWDDIPELLLESELKENNFLEISHSLKLLHGILIKYNTDDLEAAQRRLIFEEFFSEQTKLLLRKKDHKKLKAISFTEYPKNILESFPHEFTEDQKSAYSDICSDFSSGEPMMRLLQGDVGCGKTWVAFATCLLSHSNGFQSAIMCPTESLARQHYQEATNLFPHLNIKLLLGGTKASEKKEIYKDTESGSIDLVIGTHSLIQDDLKFSKLGIAIIDEQHKFGVEQRIKLVSKTKSGHCLIMTATPIPRSLSLTQYGDLDITTIKTIPSHRSGFKTRIVEEENFSKYLSFLKTRLSMNEQAYIVVPAIEDNEEMDIHNLEEVYQRFKTFFPTENIHPLHGKLTPSEKEEAFKNFKNGEIQILIATSVVEVGINVPNATIMTILNPERFGLSSLHQLRGRVGRGSKVGFCFLVIDKKLSKESRDRLNFIEKNSNGFDIAEEDLRIRGQGNILGKDQSGSDSFKRLANPIIHYPLLELARKTLYKLSDNPSDSFNSYIERVSKDTLIHNTI